MLDHVRESLLTVELTRPWICEQASWVQDGDLTVQWLERSAAAVGSASRSLPERSGLEAEFAAVAAASQRGYFLPDEDERIRFVYARYLGLRGALLETIRDLGAAAGRDEVAWREHLPVFMTAFAAACVVMRADRFVVDAAAGCPVLWKKLDEADVRTGIPRKSFTTIFKSVSHPLHVRRFLQAADFYQQHRAQIAEMADHEWLDSMVELLAAEESHIERRRRDAVKRFILYRWFSFLRRHRSAWKQVMFGCFEASGRAVAALRQPGVKPAGAAKRVTPAMQRLALAHASPGDVFVTRHDDALSNLFLPGYWPHVALFLGTTDQLRDLGIATPSGCTDQAWFLESKKDGVRIRPATETLEVDALVMLKTPLVGEPLRHGLQRAVSHAGKSYDFLFDFRTADRMVCTEVVYRGFHGIGPITFQLHEVGGRLCLPAEALIDQALGCGYQIVAAVGVEGDLFLTGEAAHVACQAARKLLDNQSL